jgi:hypothetical protein
LKQFNGYFAAKLRKNPNISKYLACFVVFAYIFGIVFGGFDICLSVAKLQGRPLNKQMLSISPDFSPNRGQKYKNFFPNWGKIFL